MKDNNQSHAADALHGILAGQHKIYDEMLRGDYFTFGRALTRPQLDWIVEDTVGRMKATWNYLMASAYVGRYLRESLQELVGREEVAFVEGSRGHKLHLKDEEAKAKAEEERIRNLHGRAKIKELLGKIADPRQVPGPGKHWTYGDIQRLVGENDPQLIAFVESAILPEPTTRLDGYTAGIIPMESLDCEVEQRMWEYDDCADPGSATVDPPMADPMRTRMMCSMLEALGFAVRGKRHVWVQLPGMEPAHGWLYKTDEDGRIALPLTAEVSEPEWAERSDVPVCWDPEKEESEYYTPKWA